MDLEICENSSSLLAHIKHSVNGYKEQLQDKWLSIKQTQKDEYTTIKCSIMSFKNQH